MNALLLIARSAVLVAALLPRISATCSASNGPCKEGSGSCSDAVQQALSGNLLDAINSLSYGKYCGANNYCKVVGKKAAISDGKCRKPNSRALFFRADVPAEVKTEQEAAAGRKSAVAPCPAVPCDKIDSACATHDACLDNEIRLNKPPPGERVPVPARCHCDVDLVSHLAVQAALTAPTGRCDADFYSTPISTAYPVTPIALLKHEAVLLAAPFCCVVYTNECARDALFGGGTNPLSYGAAYAFCTGVFYQLERQGISDICSSLE
jgi:hypothetical protein